MLKFLGGGAMFVQGAKSIPDSRVSLLRTENILKLFYFQDHNGQKSNACF